MKKLFPILFLLAPCVYACAADIPQDPQPDANAIVVGFDPTAKPNAVVPLPNDLAIATGKIVVPPTLDDQGKRIDSPAQIEFNEKYLGSLSGFPYESTASVTLSGNLDPATVNDKTVLALDVTDTTKPASVMIKPTYADQSADGKVKPTITIAAPTGNWLRGHRYAIALIGGANGLRGKEKQDVIGSTTWALVKSRNSLVRCEGDERQISFTGPTGPQMLKTNCLPAVDIIPSQKEDPQEKLDEQTGLALTLEEIRKLYDPVLKYIAGPPVNTDRKEIPMLWTFSIVDAGEMTFDPANSVIPFPNDAVRTGPQGTVALPHPKTGKPLTAADCNTTDNSILLVCGLNTLDGFSMLAPPISENSDKEGAIAQSAASPDNLIDAKTLDPKTVGLARLASADTPMAIQTTPKYTPCLNCMSSKDASGKPQTSPQQLQWSLQAPLDEHTTYMGYVTNGVKDTKGKGVVANPVFALARSKASLLDNSKCPAAPPPLKQQPCKESTSTVTLITNEQAQQLEPLRAGYEPAFDALEAAGIHREDLALAFPFTTQSASKILDQLHGFPNAAKTLFSLPDSPIFVVDASTTPNGGYEAAADAAGIPRDKIQSFFAGAFLTPVAVTGPGGTLSPTKAKLLPVSFAIAVPKGTAPAGGWPVTIFGHGITRWRNDFLAIANSLAAAGQMVIASDVVWHGDRTSCTGSKAFTGMPSDDDSCADATTMSCDEGFQGLCVSKAGARAACSGSPADPIGDGACLLAGQGRCAADKKCQGAGVGFKLDASGKPEISGWNEFSLTNFFATRDNFRQQVIDLSQLVRVLNSTDAKKLGVQLQMANGGTAIPYDTAKLGYVGQSLGGILGTLFASVSPDLHNVVLNVPGGALVQIILNAPSFATAKKALIDTLAMSGIQPGTPGFDQFIGIAQWVLDEADPAVMGYRLTHSVPVMGGKPAPPADRKALIQFIEGDETVPNISNFALVAGANRTFDPTKKPGLGCVAPLFCYEFTEAGDMFDATSAPTNARHGFLLKPPSASSAALTVKAQTQAATFLATGALP